MDLGIVLKDQSNDPPGSPIYELRKEPMGKEALMVHKDTSPKPLSQGKLCMWEALPAYVGIHMCERGSLHMRETPTLEEDSSPIPTLLQVWLESFVNSRVAV